MWAYTGAKISLEWKDEHEWNSKYTQNKATFTIKGHIGQEIKLSWNHCWQECKLN